MIQLIFWKVTLAAPILWYLDDHNLKKNVVALSGEIEVLVDELGKKNQRSHFPTCVKSNKCSQINVGKNQDSSKIAWKQNVFQSP